MGMAFMGTTQGLLTRFIPVPFWWFISMIPNIRLKISPIKASRWIWESVANAVGRPAFVFLARIPTNNFHTKTPAYIHNMLLS